MEIEELRKLADSFFEWPTEDHNHVTLTSALLFAQHVLRMAQQQAEEYRIPCDVKLPPNTRFSRGCRLSTVIAGMEMRREGIEGISMAKAQRFTATDEAQPAPIPTSERLPTAADADPWGNVLAFSKAWDVWSFSHWGTVAKYGNTIWMPTNLTRPAAPGGE